MGAFAVPFASASLIDSSFVFLFLGAAGRIVHDARLTMRGSPSEPI
jgi:hypothetical protein